MSALGLRRFYGGLQRQANVFRRCQSTDSTVSPVPPSENAGTTSTTNAPFRRTPVERPAHTHFLAIPMDNGTFLDRLVQLRNFLKKNATVAGLEPDMIIPNIKRTCLFRFGHINIEGYKTNRQPLLNQPSYQLSQVEEALEKAKTRLDTEINKEELELVWGSVSPVIPFFQDRERRPFNPGLVKILALRTQLNPAWDNMKKIRTIVFEELETAGITNVKIRESPSVHLTLINTKWRPTHVEGVVQKSKPFNIKTLYTIPGFDQFRTVPLPTSDEALSRFTPVDVGKCSISNFVLEEIGQTIDQIDTDPVITKSYDFNA